MVFSFALLVHIEISIDAMAVKAFLISERSSRKYRLNGVIPSSHLPTKSELCQSFRDHMIYQAEQLPPKVDLRSDMTPVEDQSLVASW